MAEEFNIIIARYTKQRRGGVIMRVKQLMAFGLAIVLEAGSLTGCGNSNATSKEDSSAKSAVTESGGEGASQGDAAGPGEDIAGEIRYAFWDAAQQSYLEKCVEEFNKLYPNIKITLEPSVWDEYWTKLEAGATGGSIADVFWMNGPNITKYAKGDILLPIDDLLAGSDLDKSNYPEGLVSLYHIDGKQYALPKDFDTVGVWYNKQIFDEAGVPYPSDDWTWEDMVDIAKQLTKADGSVYGIGAPYDTQVGIYNTIYASGGEIISADKKSSGYDKPETQAGVQCWIDLQEAGVSPSAASLVETMANVQFLLGRLAMYWGGSWFLAQLLDSDLKDQVDVAELPSINGKKATVIHGLGNCIYKETKYPEAAWKWVEFLAGETANKLSAETGAAIPALKGTAQAWVEKNPGYNLQSFIKSSEEYSYAYPASANTAEWEQYQADNLKKAFNLEISVQEACETLTEQMNEVLANE